MHKKPKDKYLDINGLQLHYLDWGNCKSQPMLLLHGFMSCAHAWDNFALSFRARFHIVALDQRGHGESQWPSDPSYTLDDHFSDIARFIDTLNMKSLILIGHSMGGRNALFYTSCLPLNIERLVLVDARPGNSPMASDALKQILDNLPQKVRSLNELVDVAQSVYPYLSDEICLQMAGYSFKEMSDGSFVPRDDIRMRQQSQQNGYIVEDLWPFMENITCQTLVVRGEESPFLSKEDAMKMSRVIPDAKYIEIPQATHMPVQENPEAFKKVILDFLNH
ncbi:MAG: alpha/beta hydrolase [Thermodesulfobacteriota bacterium]|nr:alpha/beta hydrolase [Thermodesulfobacteriota bacterium]